ncbi:MAG TPA: hypothetical protein VNZ53_42065 [Steroidobacteraceae bacterium]|nr:hypothetical protein [Steroidobacteraceae bacterium]
MPGQFKNDRLTDPAVAAGDDGSDMTNLSISDVGSLRSPQVERWVIQFAAGVVHVVGDLIERRHDA